MGSPFQCLTTLWVRKFFLISNLNCPWCHLRPFPHVIASHLREDANTFLTVTSFHIVVEKIFLSSNPVLLSVSFEKMRDLMKWQGLFKMTLGQTKENFSAGHSLMNAHARLSPSISAVLISREAVLGPWLIEMQISAVKGCPTVGKSGCEQKEFEIAGTSITAQKPQLLFCVKAPSKFADTEAVGTNYLPESGLWTFLNELPFCTAQILLCRTLKHFKKDSKKLK